MRILELFLPFEHVYLPIAESLGVFSFRPLAKVNLQGWCQKRSTGIDPRLDHTTIPDMPEPLERGSVFQSLNRVSKGAEMVLLDKLNGEVYMYMAKCNPVFDDDVS